MGNVAEGVLVLVEPAVGGSLDPPVGDILAVMIARREAQHLDHPGGGRRVVVGCLVRDRKSHGWHSIVTRCGPYSHRKRAPPRETFDRVGSLPRVTPALVAGIHLFLVGRFSKRAWMAVDIRAFTPRFDGLCPAMTTEALVDLLRIHLTSNIAR